MSRAAKRLSSVASILRPQTSSVTITGPYNNQQTVSASTSAVSSTSQHKTPSAMESTLYPPSGLYRPNPLKALYYGPNTVQENLLSCLPTDSSKAFIITGNSLATKTPLIKQVEDLLQTRSAHAGTFSSIKQHAPVAQLDEATDLVLADASIDTIISIGGGSPIDSAKAISYRLNDRQGSSSGGSGDGRSFLNHIAIPTTLSAAECTPLAGFTQSDGVKTGISHPSVYPSYILYDSTFALHTPPHLFLSTGIRALDHAVELQYHPTATAMPAHYVTLPAIQQLFTYLPRYKSDPRDEDTILHLFLAAYASLGFLGLNMKGGLGLSHTLGYALGSPYGIPHGVTSCLTLGHVVKLKAQASREDAERIARILPVLSGGGQQQQRSDSDVVADAQEIGDRILRLVDELGFKTTLTEKGVGKDQLDVIVQRATGGKADEKTTASVRKLVEGLY